MRLLVALSVLAVILLGGSPTASAQGHQLPLGKWQQRDDAGNGVCVEVLEDNKLRLTFITAGPDDWKPILVEGTYKVTATKNGSYHAELKIEDIRRKGISRCRKYVVNETLTETKQLGTHMRRGQILRLTLNFACAHGQERLQLCLHEPGKGEDAKPHVACKDLDRESEACKKPDKGPVIDGSMINPPPT